MKLVSSRKLPELRAGTARKPEETVFIIRKHLVMLSSATSSDEEGEHNAWNCFLEVVLIHEIDLCLTACTQVGHANPSIAAPDGALCP